MWNTVQNIGRTAYGYVTPKSWISGTQQLPPPPMPKKPIPKLAVGVTVGGVINKLSPWDHKGYVKRILAAPTEEKAVALFSSILEEDDFLKLLSNGRQALGSSDQAILIKFFSQVANKYPQYNLYSSVTAIVAQLG
jgi:hypothetical protein